MLALMVVSPTFASEPCQVPGSSAVHILGAVRAPSAIADPTGLLQGVALAGGLRDDGYSAGAILLRPGIADAPTSNPSAQIITAAWQIWSGSGADDSHVKAVARSLLAGVPYVRIPVLADPAQLQANPHLNPMLLRGDVLIYPSRPTFIAVVGQVRAPGLYAYEPGRPADHYIKAAKGFAAGAYRSGTHAIGPDGATRELRVEYWNYRHETLLPGSVIHVPAREDDPGLAAALTDQLNLHADGACTR